jgi:predicted 2-oxoglutarate/Fe(II)-dependent dioxygenase YbiX
MRRKTCVAEMEVKHTKGIISLQVLSPASCHSYIRAWKTSNDWVPAPVYKDEPDGSYGSEVKTEYRLASAFSPSSRSEIRQEFDWKVNSVIKPLINRVWQVNLTKHQATHIVRYSPGDFFCAHTDDVYEPDYRYFTVVCYLNDNYKGGRTVFPLLNYVVTPRAGKVIVFPSTYLHRADPVINGEKYIIVSWVTGTPPIKWI